MSFSLEAQQVSFSYGEQEVVRDISLTIKPGAFTAIIGPNGSGKTTLLKNLLRLLNPDKGVILLNGEDIRTLSRREFARQAGSVPQNPKLDYEYTVAETVIMGRYPHLGRFQQLSSTDYRIAEQAMERADILDLKNHPVTQISGGEAQRVIIARALTQEPRILALDEPTNHLDIRHQVAILTLLRHLCTEGTIAVVAILHDLNFALTYADQALLLHNGRVFRSGSPAEVLTEESIRTVYNVESRVERSPFSGAPHIIYNLGL